VTFIDPTVDPRRRTARVRVALDNRDGRLRPGMFAEATIETSGPGDDSPLVIPETAPLFTGRRAVVYVERESAQGVAYVPRTVRLGPLLDDVYPVVAGLAEGERVVTRGAFALDADLQIRGGPSMMSNSTERPDASPPLQLQPAQTNALAPIVDDYIRIQEALAEDTVDQAIAPARRLARAAKETEFERPAAARAAWAELAPLLIQHANAISEATSLEQARLDFEPLSEAVIDLLGRFGNPTDGPVRLAFCPMAAGSEGARWVQRGEEIDNAYFGASMRTCGEVIEEIPIGGFSDEARGVP